MTLKISKSVQHRVTVEDGELYVDTHYVNFEENVVRVTSYKGAARVEETDGEVTYFYRGARIQCRSYGPDIFGHGSPPRWETEGRHVPDCETLTEAMEQQDRKFYGPRRQK